MFNPASAILLDRTVLAANERKLNPLMFNPGKLRCTLESTWRGFFVHLSPSIQHAKFVEAILYCWAKTTLTSLEKWWYKREEQNVERREAVTGTIPSNSFSSLAPSLQELFRPREGNLQVVQKEVRYYMLSSALIVFYLSSDRLLISFCRLLF
jgi:hypothetical protein